MHEYLTSNTFNNQCMQASNSTNFLPVQKSICAKIYMDLLAKIVKAEASKLQESSRTEAMPDNPDLNILELNTLQYIAGATLHKIIQDLKDLVSRNMISEVHQAKIQYRCLQLSKKLILPQGMDLRRLAPIKGK